LVRRSLKVDDENARALSRALLQALDAEEISESLAPNQVTPFEGTTIEEMTGLADFASAGTSFVEETEASPWRFNS
jgi:hypothetical protein